MQLFHNHVYFLLKNAGVTSAYFWTIPAVEQVPEYEVCTYLLQGEKSVCMATGKLPGKMQGDGGAASHVVSANPAVGPKVAIADLGEKIIY